MLVTIEVEVPDWARWLAQDKNGEWWVYSNRPKINRSYCYWDVVDHHRSSAASVGRGNKNPNWQQELYELIQE